MLKPPIFGTKNILMVTRVDRFDMIKTMKKFFLGFLVLALAFSFFAGSAWAKNEPKKEIPEVDGVYDDPDFSGLKVKVFVHKNKSAKPGKPTQPPPVWQCGLDDPASTATVSAEIWKLSSGWKYNLNPGSVPALVGSGNLVQIALNGFNAWKAPTGLVFIQGENTTVNRQAYDHLNIISWGRISSSALGVTYIRYYPDTGKVVDVDTILNQKYTWAWSGGTTQCAYLGVYDAENILTHELGHWIGLDDEYTDEYQNATMYGYGTTWEVKKDTLSAGDFEGAAAIYR